VFIPFGDENIKGGYKPIVSYSLIAINLAVFIFQMVGVDINLYEEFINTYGAVPSEVIEGNNPISILTHMYMHGGILHLLGNLLFLWIFADNIEATIGSLNFAFFYLLGGLFALSIHMLTDLGSTIPVVGASGAISAVMGAYMVMFPKSKIKVLILVFKKHLPAFIFLGLWFVTQLVSGLKTFAPSTPEEAAGVAWWAHIGGFVFGLVVGWFLKEKEQKASERWL